MYPALLVLGVLLFVGVCAWFARHDAFSWFHPLTVYLMFHGLVFTLRPIFAWWLDYGFVYSVYAFTPDGRAKAMALIAANLGLVAFAAAAMRFGNAPFRFPTTSLDDRARKDLLRPLLVVGAALAPIAAWSLYKLWLERSGATDTILLDTRTGVSIHAEGSGYLTEAQAMLVPLSLLFAWLNRFRLWSLVPLALFILFRAASGGRGAIVMALFALACYVLYDRRRTLPDGRSVLALAAAGLIFASVGADRGQAVRAVFSQDHVVHAVATPENRIFEGMDLANLEYLEYLTHTVPARTGTYEFFIDQLQVLTEPIPRALWPGKPIGQPIRLFDLFDYGFPIGMTRSLPGEGWMQLGLVGVALWCGLWGAVLGGIYRRFALGPQQPWHVALYFAFLPLMILFYRDGIPLTVLRQGLFLIGPVVAWMLLARLMGAMPQRPSDQDDRPAPSVAAPTRAGRRPTAPPPRAHRPADDLPHAESSARIPRAWRR